MTPMLKFDAASTRHLTESSFGVPEIDSLGDAQLRAGHLYLITGSPGSGKTGFAIDLAKRRLRTHPQPVLVCVTELSLVMRAEAEADDSLYVAQVDSFNDGIEAVHHLTREHGQPFLVVLDNLPSMRSTSLDETQPGNVALEIGGVANKAKWLACGERVPDDTDALAPMAVVATVRSRKDVNDAPRVNMMLDRNASMIIHLDPVADPSVKVIKNKIGRRG